jgi:hypothetical protein
LAVQLVLVLISMNGHFHTKSHVKEAKHARCFSNELNERPMTTVNSSTIIANFRIPLALIVIPPPPTIFSLFKHAAHNKPFNFSIITPLFISSFSHSFHPSLVCTHTQHLNKKNTKLRYTTAKAEAAALLL